MYSGLRKIVRSPNFVSGDEAGESMLTILGFLWLEELLVLCFPFTSCCSMRSYGDCEVGGGRKKLTLGELTIAQLPADLPL